MGGLNCARARKDPGTNNSANDRLEFARRKLPVDSTVVVSDAQAPGRKRARPAELDVGGRRPNGDSPGGRAR